MVVDRAPIEFDLHQARAALAETIWNAENVELATVGIDIGSSTGIAPADIDSGAGPR